MLLIIDSGSTKSDWVLISPKKEALYFETIGLNPNFVSRLEIEGAIQSLRELVTQGEQIEQIFFYGAGCTGVIANNTISETFADIFTKAKIEVQSDLIGACLSVYSGKSAIVGILGTGSNATFFDGKQCSQKVPALGYIIGDEGSGAFFGKSLLASYFYKKLPRHLALAFDKEFELTKETMVEMVYRQAFANRYLASFTTFISKHRKEAFMQDLLHDGFTQFFQNQVCVYENFRELEVHFVGSIAFIFQEELKLAAEALEITIGKIAKKPIEGLVAYHLNH